MRAPSPSPPPTHRRQGEGGEGEGLESRKPESSVQCEKWIGGEGGTIAGPLVAVPPPSFQLFKKYMPNEKKWRWRIYLGWQDNGFFHYCGQAIFSWKFVIFNGNSRNFIFVIFVVSHICIHKRFSQKWYMQTLGSSALVLRRRTSRYFRELQILGVMQMNTGLVCSPCRRIYTKCSATLNNEDLSSLTNGPTIHYGMNISSPSASGFMSNGDTSL